MSSDAVCWWEHAVLKEVVVAIHGSCFALWGVAFALLLVE